MEAPLSPRDTALLSELLPPGVAMAEQVGAVSGILWPEEEEVLGRVVPKRKMEFAAGRTCAREALNLLGVPKCAILRGTGREPLWPDGVVGSITHCNGYCAAAVAYADQVLSLGIDAEPDEPLPEGVLPLIARQEEAERLAQRPPGSGQNLDRLLFSAKESTYKAWYPLGKRWLNFDEVRIDIIPERNSFALYFLGSPRPEIQSLRFSGRYSIRNGLILTSVIAQCG